VNKPTNTITSADLLVELGCEELPPKTLPKLAKAFYESLKSQLIKAELDFNLEASRFYYTPRRLTLLMSEVAASQPDQTLERKGPALSAAFDADNQPTPAAMGLPVQLGKLWMNWKRLKGIRVSGYIAG